MTTDTINAHPRTLVHPDPAAVRRLVERRSVATLATVSAAGRPHAATVLYAVAEGALYVSTDRDSRKARNVAETGHAAIAIAVRRLPVGPPSGIQFQAPAEVLATDDPAVTRLAADGRLRAITAHGELELPDGCFLRLELPSRAHTYGIGMSMWQLLRHPLEAAGEVDLRA